MGAPRYYLRLLRIHLRVSLLANSFCSHESSHHASATDGTDATAEATTHGSRSGMFISTGGIWPYGGIVEGSVLPFLSRPSLGPPRATCVGACAPQRRVRGRFRCCAHGDDLSLPLSRTGTWRRSQTSCAFVSGILSTSPPGPSPGTHWYTNDIRRSWLHRMPRTLSGCQVRRSLHGPRHHKVYNLPIPS